MWFPRLVDLNSVADELYALDPAEFVEERSARARSAKAAGERDLAAQIRLLRRPTVAAAALNRMARDQAGPLAELAALGTRLRDRQAQFTGPELRALVHRRHELVRQLIRSAPALRETVAREVEDALGAVVTDPTAAEDALAGHLATAPQPTSDLIWPTPTTEAPPPPPRPRPAPAPAPAPKEPAGNDQAQAKKKAAEEKQRKERHGMLRRKAAELAQDRDRAKTHAAQAAKRAEKAAEKSQGLRDRLAEAEEAQQRAEDDAEAARSTLEDAERAAHEAQDEVDSLA